MAIFELAALAPLGAQTFRTWGAGSNNPPTTNWTAGRNWSNNNAPTSAGEVALFNSTFGVAPIVSSSFNLGGMQFGSSLGQDFTIGTSGGTVTLAGFTGLGIDNESSHNVTINPSFTLGANQTWQDSVSGGSFTVTGALNLNGHALTLNTANANNSITLSGVISGTSTAGTLTAQGSGTVLLSGINSYTGATNITGGTVQVTNSNSLGAIPGGAVTISNGGTLDIGGGTANAINFGAKQFNISGAGVGGNGAIVNSSATNSQNNAFQNITLTGDATIGGTSRWDMRGGAPVLNLGTNTLTKTGSNQVSIVGGTISGDGNIVVNQGEFAIQTTSNATGAGTFTFNNGTTLGLWHNTGTVTTAMAFNGTNTVLNESGASVIGSNLTVNGTTNFNILNAGTTPSLTLNGQLAINGAANFNIAAGTSLTLAGPLAGSGTATMIGADATGILALGANQLFNGTLNLASGTLDLAGFNLTLNTLHITGNSTIDFGAGVASILNTTYFIIDPGVTLTIADWANTVDYFYAQNFSGAAYNIRGVSPQNQVSFTGFSANNTIWLSNDNQITPVPEPATYGALLTAVVLGIFLWHRRKMRPAPVMV